MSVSRGRAACSGMQVTNGNIQCVELTSTRTMATARHLYPLTPFRSKALYPRSRKRPDEVVLWAKLMGSNHGSLLPGHSRAATGHTRCKQGMTLVGSFSEQEKPPKGGGPDKAVLCGVHYPWDLHNPFISDLVLLLLSSSRGIDGQLEEGVPEKDPCSVSSFSNQCALWRRHM